MVDDSVKKPKNIVDVGCGIGGSSRYLARKFGANCNGITLSPVQAQRGQELAAVQGLDDKVCMYVFNFNSIKIFMFDLFLGCNSFKFILGLRMVSLPEFHS